MRAHWDAVVKPLLEAASPRVVVEIGVFRGANTEQLLALAGERDFVLHSIDPEPAPSLDVAELESRHGERFVYHPQTSLEALADMDAVDAVLIDGDHNWYTVYNELKLLERAARHARRPFPTTMLHDVEWPYARRDLYYNPETVPAEHRHAHKRGGLMPGEGGVLDEGGVNWMHDHALEEGTPRNGVLTAVEDFLAESEMPLDYRSVPGYTGLGIVVDRTQVGSNPRLRDVLERFGTREFLTEQIRRLDEARLLAETEIPKMRRALQEAWDGRRRQRLRADALEADVARLEGELEAARRELDALRAASSTRPR